MTMEKRVGFAGLGLMGQGMAANLLAKGLLVGVWNRTPERCRAFAPSVPRARSPRELAEMSDVVVTCVSDPEAVERVVFAEDGVLAAARPGFRYVETSTVGPAQVRRIADALRARGADALDAPMTGSKLGAAGGTLLFMTGGRVETHAELLPVLLAMGAKAIHCGASGQGALMKLINNTLISFMLEGLCEGLVVARKGGLALETLLEVVMASGYASPYYAFKGGAIARRDFETHFSIDLLVKDQGLMLAEAAAQRTPLPGLAAIREVHQAARALGHGAEDIAAVVQAVEKLAGL
jgi:3-hydroxyisobutyrate dehydrogenase-like beta-hydroxyacid dehydrogenase